VIGYASRTGTRRNLDVLRAAGWRLLVSATGVWRTEGFRYGIDNGAWTAHQAGTPWDEQAFRGVIDELGSGADWIVLPDIVCGGLPSLDLSLSWLPPLALLGVLLLIPVQDGMTPDLLRPHVGSSVGIFVGGSTEWKEASLPMWGGLKREVGCWLHVGRVNSARRIRLCHLAGADSFDGTSVTRFAITLPRLDRARRQRTLFTGE
jgi:hypothetical protein